MVLNFIVNTGVEEADQFIISFIIFVYIMLLGMLIFLSLTFDSVKCKANKSVIFFNSNSFSISNLNFTE
jgi:hypothetical protein